MKTFLFWVSHLTHLGCEWLSSLGTHCPSGLYSLQFTLKLLDQAWDDGLWEEKIQICTKGIDPSWVGTIRGLKRASYVNIVPYKIVFCKHDLRWLILFKLHQVIVEGGLRVFVLSDDFLFYRSRVIGLYSKNK